MTFRNEQTDAVWANLTLTRGVYEDWNAYALSLLMSRFDHAREPRAILADKLKERNAHIEGTLLVDWDAIADRILQEAQNAWEDRVAVTGFSLVESK